MAHANREYAVILRALRTRGCHVCQEWLSGCIDFYRSEHNQYSPKDLENFVFEQWTLGDLQDVAGVGSLPANLSNILKRTIEGKMACQVQSVTDIGHSCYTQMQRLRKEDVGNLNVDEVKEFQQAWEPKANRMLQLTLFDGAQTVKAIEYQPIRNLKIDIIPGTKILLQGPITCRRGILMLEERHIAILGGEVDSLHITNAYENILARSLGLPENPNPYNLTTVADELPAAQPRNPPEPSQQTVEQHSRQASRQSPPPQSQINNSNQRAHEATAKQPARKMVQATLAWSRQPQDNSRPPPPQAQLEEFCGNDEDFLNIPLNDVDWEAKIDCQSKPSVNVSRSTYASNQTENSTTAQFEMGSDEEAELLEAEASLALNTDGPSPCSRPLNSYREPVEEAFGCKRPAPSVNPDEFLRKPLFAKRRKETSSQEVSSTSDLDYFVGSDLLDFEEPWSEVHSFIENKLPVTLSPDPFVYLSQVIGHKRESSETFRVKAAVMTVTEKLSISNGEWKLSAKITDGSANMDVRFSAKVLKEIIGMSAKEMNEMKKQMSQQPGNKEIIRKKLERAQVRLINLNSLLDLKTGSDLELPTVVGLTEISKDVVSTLKRRQCQV